MDTKSDSLEKTQEYMPLQDDSIQLIQQQKSNNVSHVKVSPADTQLFVSWSSQNQRATKSSLLRLLKYTLKQKCLLFWGNIGLLVTSFGLVALPYICGQIIDSISKNDGNLGKYSIQFIIIFTVAAIFGFIRGSSYNLIGEKVMIELRNELFAKMIAKDIEFFDQNRSGELISRITSDITVIQSAASDNISMLLRNIVQLFGSIILLWLITWKLTLVMLASAPAMAAMVSFFIRYSKKYTKEYQNLTAQSTQIATEALGNMRVVRSFSTELQESENFNKSTNQTFEIGRKRALLYGIFNCFGTMFGYGIILLVLWYGGKLVQNKELSVGELSSFVMYTITLTVSLITVSASINMLINASAVSEKIFQIMDEPIKVQDGHLVINKHAFQGEIQFDDISFSYPTKEGVLVLKKISLRIEPGDVVAFVGQSGSGKSTIVSLIERFYDVNEGTIKIDAEDIKSYNLRKLHEQIGFVSQEPTLFSGTLEQNITYGLKEYTQDEIIQAMKMANAFDFVTNKEVFPEGLQTIVGERGIKLSGGQKQRIAIARALIKNPKILIFDEATSALDAESEHYVQTAIDGLVQDGQKTIIIIAHRLSTIRNSKKIVVLQNGFVVEVGNHQELINQNGAYRKLIDRQLQGME